MVSCGPPAAKGMTMVTGRVGQSCAPAEPVNPTRAARTAPETVLIIAQSPFPAHSWPGGRPWSSLARRLKCHRIILATALFRIADQPPPDGPVARHPDTQKLENAHMPWRGFRPKNDRLAEA